MQNDTKIVFTGGHAGTTGLAVIEALKKKYPSLKSIYWIGAKKAVEGKKAQTLESEILPKKSVKFVPLYSGRIQQKFTFWTIPSLLSIPIGFIHAFFILLAIRPKVIVSFGGFSSFPTVVTAWLQGIPVIIHEQVATSGRANRASSFFAIKIALARSTSLKYFPKKKSLVVGNPVSEKILSVSAKKVLGNPPTIFITGGSRGSLTINNCLKGILPHLLTKYNIVHLAGLFDLPKFQKLKENLPENLSTRYKVYGSINPDDMASFYGKADLVIARAGANTVSEVIVTKRPSIFIPLPFSYLNEQMQNARLAVDLGLAVVLDQKDLTPELLQITIEEVIRNWGSFVKKVENHVSSDVGATQKMVGLISEYLS